MNKFNLTDLADLYLENMQEINSIDSKLQTIMHMSKERVNTGYGRGYVKFPSPAELEKDMENDKESITAEKESLERRKKECRKYLGELEQEIVGRVPAEVAFFHNDQWFYVEYAGTHGESHNVKMLTVKNG